MSCQPLPVCAGGCEREGGKAVGCLRGSDRRLVLGLSRSLPGRSVVLWGNPVGRPLSRVIGNTLNLKDSGRRRHSFLSAGLCQVLYPLLPVLTAAPDGWHDSPIFQMRQPPLRAKGSAQRGTE